MDEFVILMRQAREIEEQMSLLKPKVLAEMRDKSLKAIDFKDGSLTYVSKRVVKWSVRAKEEIKKLDAEVKSQMRELGEFSEEEQNSVQWRPLKEDNSKEAE